MALTDGLVGLWSPFMGASGYRLLDRSGRGNHGTLTNMDAGTDWVGATVNGRSGYALDFDGSNDRIDIDGRYSQSLPMTLAMWVMRTADWHFAGNCLFWAKANATFNGNGFYVEPGSGAAFSYHTIVVVDGFGPYLRLNQEGNTSFPLNKWTHFAFTISSPTVAQFYLDGVSASTSVSGTLSVTSTSDTKYIFNNSPGYGNYIPGKFAGGAAWSRALQQSEISTLYRLGPGWYNRTSTTTYGFVPAVGGVTGDLSATLESLTLSSSSDLADGASGSLSASLDSATLSSSATLADGLSASLAATLGNATLSSSADVVDGGSGSLSATLGNASVSSSAILEDGLTASLSKTLDDATLSASGAESVGLAGDLSATLDAATVSSSATLADGLSGSLSASLSDATLSSSATLADGATGSVSATLDSCTVSSSGSFGAGLTAELNAALDSATVSSSGTLANGLTANLSVQLASATLAASGVIGTPSTNSNFKINVGGTWKEATPFVNVGGVWKQATPFIKINGEWK